MKVLRNQNEILKENISGSALTIGSFDGVHLGHRFLIERLKALAPGKPVVVVTFDPHPAKILSPNPPPRIFSAEDQVEQFAALGVDYLYFLPFTREISEMPAEDFAKQYIFDSFKPTTILSGYDFAFGKDRKGNFSLLQKVALQYQCRVEKGEPLKIDEQIVSSTLIRGKIQSGEMSAAHKLLGRPFYLQGPVVHGYKRGRTIGVPTANLETPSEITPASGVYMVRVHVGGGSHYGLCNVGFNPTVESDGLLKIECYILDFNQDIYGQTLQIEFLERIRNELKFSSLEALKEKIQEDIEWARKFIQRSPKV